MKMPGKQTQPNTPEDPAPAKTLRTPEILAPAGTEEAMKAAVNAGCDAVYLGGNLFSARAFAGNFDEEAVLRTLDHCHLFGVKVYMTVNTLLKDEETQVLAEYMRPFYQAGLDGVIVQDPGVVRILRREFPDLHLHGSTQMSIASASGARFLKAQGLTRVVPARELTLQEIRQIRDEVEIEIESFVHGAMCYAYSGKCLFSSFLGGRSGNRGRCAQPCRQLYGIDLPAMPANAPAKEYLMSMKDMCTLPVLPELIDAGIDSFKIEGRMKNPSYVAATVDAYRRARDRYLDLTCDSTGRNSSEDTGTAGWKKEYEYFVRPLIGNMQDIYNRGGFYTGYYFPAQDKAEKGKGPFTPEKGPFMIARKRPNHTGLLIGKVEKVQGPEVWIMLQHEVHPQDVLEIEGPGIELTSNAFGAAGKILQLKGKELRKIRPGMKVYRTRNNVLLEEIEQRLLLLEKSIGAKAIVTARVGKPLGITIISDDGQIRCCAEGSVVAEATGRPTAAGTIEEKMQKTGGTHVRLAVSCEIDDNSFVPMSELNALRREAIEMFKTKLTGRYHRAE